MNLPQFLQAVGGYTARMTREELEACIHELGRILPEEQRDDFLFVVGKSARGVASAPETSAPLSLLEQLKEISSGAYRLDSEYNEEWDDWYNNEVDEFTFHDPDKLVDTVLAACAELHRLVDSTAYTEAYRFGQNLRQLKICVDGDFSDCCDDTMDIEGLVEYNAADIPLKNFLLDMACAAYFGLAGEERLAALYELGECFHENWTLEELMRYAPEELPGLPEFLADWAAYLGNIPEKNAAKFLAEAFSLIDSPAQLMGIAGNIAALHPEAYPQAVEAQPDDAARLSAALEAMQNIHPAFKARSRAALLAADAALRLGDTEKAAYCRKEAFRSDSTPTGFLRALLNAGDYDQCFAELWAIYAVPQSLDTRSIQPQNRHSEETGKFIRFLSGEIRQDSTEKVYSEHNCAPLDLFAALNALYLYPGEVLLEGGQAICRFLAKELSFSAAEYARGTESPAGEDNAALLWKCLQQCRQHAPLDDRPKALALLQKQFAAASEFVIRNTKRAYYKDCAELAAVIGEIMEGYELISSKNDFLLECKAIYPRHSSYHAELRNYGMRDKKKK